VTVTLWSGKPETETVRVAIRVTSDEFSPKFAVMVPFPVPEGVAVHHPALLEADQDVLEVTVKVVFPAAAATLRFDGATDKVGVKPEAVKVPAIPGA